jgi:hypothetical protein
MAHPYHHALSSVRTWGGAVEDYRQACDGGSQPMGNVSGHPLALLPLIHKVNSIGR